MKRLLIFFFVLIFTSIFMQGCGGGGGGDGDGASALGLEEGTPLLDVDGDGSGDGSVGEVGDLGALIDLGDLVFPDGDHWYSTRARAINAQGTVIGESNQGNITSAAFKWDPSLPADQAMTFLGIHGSSYNDYYNQLVNVILYPRSFSFSEAIDINGAGTIIGNSLADETAKRAFLWENGVFVDLPPIPSVLVGGVFEINEYSEAVDINEKGEIVLTLEDNTPTGRHAFYWDGFTTMSADIPRDDGTFISIVVPAYEPLGAFVGETSEAVAINENGQTLMNSGGSALFVDRNWGVIEALNHLPGAIITVAVDLNDSVYTNNDNIPDGHITGNSGNFDKAAVDAFLKDSYLSADDGTTLAELGDVQGFFWDGGAMYPINHLGGGKSVAADLNNKDQVVGGAVTAEGAIHAFSWTLGTDKKGIIKDLGTLGGTHSMALAINESGQVVGWSETGNFYEEQGVLLPVRHGFLWDNGTMSDLGTHDDFYDFPFKPPYPFSEAVDINEFGDLTGNSTTINDHIRDFYLQSVAPIP